MNKSRKLTNMTFDEFTAAFLTWTEEKIESKGDGDWPVCPYARKARLTNKIQFIDAREDVHTSLKLFDDTTYEIGIAWLGDDNQADIEATQKVIDFYGDLNPSLLYFMSTTDSGAFEKNFTNCVFIQLKDDILVKRNWLLENTSYYNDWSPEYFKSITGLDKT